MSLPCLHISLSCLLISYLKIVVLNFSVSLQEGGFDSEPFDWIICNSGADIWHALNRAKHGEAIWDADEEWENHIQYRQGIWLIIYLICEVFRSTKRARRANIGMWYFQA